jgi:hypothetical protein
MRDQITTIVVALLAGGLLNVLFLISKRRPELRNLARADYPHASRAERGELWGSAGHAGRGGKLKLKHQILTLAFRRETW